MVKSPARVDAGSHVLRERRGAARFFWLWLIVATSMSVTGNVAHAVLHAPASAVALAAGAALVPPVVLLAATHSVALLVRTRAGGVTYWCALVMTLALAACAFVLSFDALRSLAITLGLPGSIAWLWPCAIDVAIAQATLCLLSLSRRGGALAGDAARTVRSEPHTEAAGRMATSQRLANRRLTAEPRESTESPESTEPRSADRGAVPVTTDRDPNSVQRWTPIAQSLVQEGITSKEPGLVAAILAQRAAGVAPSTIGRTYKVHHTTVGRILSAADEMTA
jgi:hypothetical protein